MSADTGRPEHAPLLETERLLLRVPEKRWAPEISAYYRQNHAHFAPYCPRRPLGYHDATAWETRAEELRASSDEKRGLHLWLFERRGNSLVGDVNFTGVMGGAFQAAYLGYQLDRDAVGKGLMTEALRAAIPYAMASLELHRIMANYVPTNERSGRVLERLGFVVEGRAREYLLLDGIWKDHVLTALVNANWKAQE